MLEQISWKEFLTVIGGATAAYYGILLVAGKIRTPRNKVVTDPSVFSFSQEKKITPSPDRYAGEKGSAVADLPADPDEATEEADDPEFAELEELADELQIIIAQFATTNGSKEELLGHVAKEIGRYPSLHKPAFQRAIINLVIKVAKEECALTISEDEARLCWPDA